MAEPLFRPDASCPKCGKPPRLGYTREQLAKWANDRGDVVVQTYQCSFLGQRNRACNTVYRIRAGDLHRARLIESAVHIEG